MQGASSQDRAHLNSPSRIIVSALCHYARQTAVILMNRPRRRKAFFPDLASTGELRIMGGRGRSDRAREGRLVPDKSAQIVVDALCCAAAEPAGLPLHGSKANPGLFANTAPAKQ